MKKLSAAKINRSAKKFEKKLIKDLVKIKEYRKSNYELMLESNLRSRGIVKSIEF